MTQTVEKIKAWQGLVAIAVGLTVFVGAIGGFVTKFVLGPLTKQAEQHEVALKIIAEDREAFKLFMVELRVELAEIKRRLEHTDKLELINKQEQKDGADTAKQP